MVVFVALGLLAGLVGCGGSGINAEGNQDKAFVVTEFIAGTEFDGTRAEAECVVDELIDFLDITYAEFRAALESEHALAVFLMVEPSATVYIAIRIVKGARAVEIAIQKVTEIDGIGEPGSV